MYYVDGYTTRCVDIYKNAVVSKRLADREIISIFNLAWNEDPDGRKRSEIILGP